MEKNGITIKEYKNADPPFRPSDTLVLATKYQKFLFYFIREIHFFLSNCSIIGSVYMFKFFFR